MAISCVIMHTVNLSSFQVEKSVPAMLTVGLAAASGTNQVADITEEPNPLELSKEALARRPSFRYVAISIE